MSVDIPTLVVIIPCYYEEDVLSSTMETLLKVLDNAITNQEASNDSYLCFVNDGSKDQTWALIKKFSNCKERVQGINLSRNFGHQAALLAGLFNSTADVYISIDADLQDDESKIHEMLQAYKDGYDIVYGVRNDRESDTFFKRNTAALFYSLRLKLGCETIPNHADFRLMSSRAVDALRQFSEVNLFLRGMVPLLGYPSTNIYYARKDRTLGASKYPLFKMIKLAWQGIVNFSEAPIYMILWLGLALFFICVIASCYSLVQWYLGSVVSGWTSLFLIVCFFGSFNFMFLGVIGLYLGKVFNETKHRPRFFIQESTMN